jgi:ABC-type arginine transport system permease subunit
LLVLVLAAVIWALYTAARELFRAGERVLIAFASLLGVLVRTLPSIVLAGVIALGGVWLMNHLDNDLIQLPVAFNQIPSSPAPVSGNASSPAGQPVEKR